MNDHENETSYRKVGVEGVDKLLWVTQDSGAFDGPLMDWEDEKDYFIEKVKNFDVVVQAGGNCGMYPRFYKNYFKEIYTFEPDDLNYYCLDTNCQGSEYHKFFGGLGNTTDKLSVRRSSMKNVGMHRIDNTSGNVQMYRIDDLNLPRCDLIHLDIEGYEPNAILGASETIKKFRPVVITERSGGQRQLIELGYKVHKNLRMDTVFIPTE
jgi:FkbM family methyltransferase